MPNYIFLTNDWFTQDNSWNNIENSQLLWITNWKDSQQAFENLLKENEWIQQSDFSNVFCYVIDSNTTELFYCKHFIVKYLQ